MSIVVAVFQSLSRVRHSATPWTAARQASLSFTISRSLLKLLSIESVMPSNHLMLCCPPSLLALHLSQYRGLFRWVSSSHQVENWWEQQWDAPKHLLEGPKSKCWQQQMLVRMRSGKNSHSLLEVMNNGVATLEDNLANFYWTYSLYISQQSCAFIVTKMSWTFMSTQNLHVDIYGTITLIAKAWRQDVL